MRYTVVGAGAIGGTLAFHLARAGHEVTAIDTDAAHVAAIRRDGLRIRRPDGTEEIQHLHAAATPTQIGGSILEENPQVGAQNPSPNLQLAAPRPAPDEVTGPGGATAPAEATAPAGATAPGEATAPGGTTAHGGATAPSEAPAPAGATAPSEATAPNEATAPAGATAPSGATAPGGVARPFEAVILAVKAQATAEAAAWIAPRLAADGFVVSLQNGLCEPAIAEAVGADRTVAAFVNLFADLVEPGVIADGGPGALVVGELDGTVSPRVRALVDDLQAWGPAVADGNVAGHLWSKLAYSAVAAASATVDAPVADTIEERPAMTAALAREVYAVAAAEGVRPEPFDAWRASAFVPGAAAADTAAGLADFCAWLRTQPKDKTGIWRDLAVRRRKTEVPAILGAALARAAAHGLTCPGAEAVLRVIRDLEDGTRRMSPANLDEIESATRTAPA